MIDLKTLRTFLFTLPEVTEEPHFEKSSFRVKGKIVATFDVKNNRLCIKLSEIDQSAFSAADAKNIYPVDNKWGEQGWTFIELNNIHHDLLKDAITTAYCTVAPKKLADLVRLSQI